MNKAFVFSFLKRHSLGVISSVSKDGHPEAALVGIAVSGDLDIVFDTVKSSRKYQNIIQNPKVALVIGWENETTVQIEGIATELVGEEAASYKEVYFAVYPDGRERAENWPGLVHFRVTPTWLRYSNFNIPVVIEEMEF